MSRKKNKYPLKSAKQVFIDCFLNVYNYNKELDNYSFWDFLGFPRPENSLRYRLFYGCGGFLFVPIKNILKLFAEFLPYLIEDYSIWAWCKLANFSNEIPNSVAKISFKIFTAIAFPVLGSICLLGKAVRVNNRLVTSPVISARVAYEIGGKKFAAVSIAASFLLYLGLAVVGIAALPLVVGGGVVASTVAAISIAGGWIAKQLGIAFTLSIGSLTLKAAPTISSAIIGGVSFGIGMLINKIVFPKKQYQKPPVERINQDQVVPEAQLIKELKEINKNKLEQMNKDKKQENIEKKENNSTYDQVNKILKKGASVPQNPSQEEVRKPEVNQSNNKENQLMFKEGSTLKLEKYGDHEFEPKSGEGIFGNAWGTNGRSKVKTTTLNSLDDILKSGDVVIDKNNNVYKVIDTNGKAELKENGPFRIVQMGIVYKKYIHILQHFKTEDDREAFISNKLSKATAHSVKSKENPQIYSRPGFHK